MVNGKQNFLTAQALDYIGGYIPEFIAAVVVFPGAGFSYMIINIRWNHIPVNPPVLVQNNLYQLVAVQVILQFFQR
ncbi:hypothetical protein SDC9_168041 [bioreactor metagenome]|uniref:Uncharacterized protein n=1 Tax=bioreactor metagenome TaxID=1076179 RepID=A0A645G3Z0_9ZZZZ